MKHIVPLHSEAALREERVGGKAASLARLLGQGFQVPPGYVITVPTLRVFLAHHHLESVLQRQEWTSADSQRIRAQILSLPVPDKLKRPILAAYGELGGPVAVRSSMVSEDGEAASFAGQLDTVLNVEGQTEILEAVKQCWSSLLNWRLLTYLAERERLPDPPLLDLGLAVIMQRMVEARAAGVAFSADPVSGQPDVIIEAVRGLGDVLVAGRVTPDRYRVDRHGHLVEATPVDAGSPVLETTQVLHLAQLIRQAAATSSHPQDIEWAWDGKSVYLLQSRPITSLVGLRVYSNTMASEMVPGLIKPLVWSYIVPCKLEKVFGRVLTELIGPNDYDFKLLAKPIHSRIYVDQTMLDELLVKLGLPDNFAEIMHHQTAAKHRQRMSLNPSLIRTLARIIRFAWQRFRSVDRISAYVQQHQQDLEPYRRAEWSTQNPQELLAETEKLATVCSETMWFTFIARLNMQLRYGLLRRLLIKWAPDINPAELINGLAGVKSLETHYELQRLALLAKQLGPQARHVLLEESDETIRSELITSQAGLALISAVDAFLGEYGFLSTLGTDFSQEPWIENPTPIWQAIGRLAAAPEEGGNGRRAAVLRDEARQRTLAQLRGPRRALFSRLLPSTVTYISLQENTSMLIAQDTYQMRRLFLTIARGLVQTGALHDSADLFYLTRDEVQQLLHGQLPHEVAQDLVTTRRLQMDIDAHLDLPDTIYGDCAPAHSARPSINQAYLEGLSGSAGRAEGAAQILFNPAQAPATLSKSDILVVPFTDVSWTPLLIGVGGIVAETGGQLSHTSIVAREYGLPAVVNVKRATQVISDGQAIVVDGNDGRVYLL